MTLKSTFKQQLKVYTYYAGDKITNHFSVASNLVCVVLYWFIKSVPIHYHNQRRHIVNWTIEPLGIHIMIKIQKFSCTKLISKWHLRNQELISSWRNVLVYLGFTTNQLSCMSIAKYLVVCLAKHPSNSPFNIKCRHVYLDEAPCWIHRINLNTSGEGCGNIFQNSFSTMLGYGFHHENLFHIWTVFMVFFFNLGVVLMIISYQTNCWVISRCAGDFRRPYDLVTSS